MCSLRLLLHIGASMHRECDNDSADDDDNECDEFADEGIQTSTRNRNSRVRCLRKKKSVDAPARLAMHPPVPPKFQCCHMTHMHTTTKADFFRSRLALDQAYGNNIEIWGKGAGAVIPNAERTFFFANTGMQIGSWMGLHSDDSHPKCSLAISPTAG